MNNTRSQTIYDRQLKLKFTTRQVQFSLFQNLEFGIASMINVILQSLGLDLVYINVYANVYQNVPNGL